MARGVTSFKTRTGGLIQADGFIGSQILTQGKQFYVKPRTGSDGSSGRSPSQAVKTLAKALSLATAKQNDTVFLFAEGHAAADTTDYQSETLDWNKDLVHLIGVHAGGPVAQRARVALLSTYATASNLFTLSGHGCLIQDVHFFAGVASANPTGCMKVTGQRNVFRNCHIAGIGNDANDIAGAYSVLLDGGAENLFDDCTIGLDTIARGTAANSGLLVDTAATRNEFRNCRFIAQLEHATNHVHVRLADATAIDRYLLFRECLFYYMSANYATAGTGVMNLPLLTQGYVIVDRCMAFSDAHGTAIKWDVNDRDRILLMHAPTPAADTAGVARAV